MDWSGILIGGAIAGFVLFCWYGVAWMGLPHHKGDYMALPNADELAEGLEKVPPANAWYSLPHYNQFPQGMKDPAFDERMRKGPNAVLVICPPGPVMEGRAFATGLVLNLLEGIGCGFLLELVGRSVAGVATEVAFFGLLGLVIALTTYGAQTIYAKYPLRFTLTNVFDKTVGYALVGLVLYLLGPVAG